MEKLHKGIIQLTLTFPPSFARLLDSVRILLDPINCNLVCLVFEPPDWRDGKIKKAEWGGRVEQAVL